MNPRERLAEIAAFLKPYQRIWENEIMLRYPSPLEDYPSEWIQAVAAVSKEEDVIRLERKEYEGLIHSSSLALLYQTVQRLCEVDPAPELPPMPETPFTFLHMIPKKQHEIRRLAPVIHAVTKEIGAGRIIDIGGGIGLLAQTLTNQYNLRVETVDMDPGLQNTGINRHEKNYKHPDNKVRYHELKVSTHEPRFQALLNEDAFTVGLHTCGPLALDQLQASAHAKVKGLINLGCCYQRLGSPEVQNVSAYARTLPNRLDMNLFALTLAARAHCKMDEKDYRFKLKVKYYRYALHMLLHDRYGLPRVLNLGNSSRKLYEGPFSGYATEQFARLGMETPSEKELEDHYADPERQKLIWDMLAAGLIRNIFGRPLEMYLLLDRMIYLEENGYATQLLEVFNETVSPRNLGIVARRLPPASQ